MPCFPHCFAPSRLARPCPALPCLVLLCPSPASPCLAPALPYLALSRLALSCHAVPMPLPCPAPPCPLALPWRFVAAWVSGRGAVEGGDHLSLMLWQLGRRLQLGAGLVVFCEGRSRQRGHLDRKACSCTFVFGFVCMLQVSGVLAYVSHKWHALL